MNPLDVDRLQMAEAQRNDMSQKAVETLQAWVGLRGVAFRERIHIPPLRKLIFKVVPLGGDMLVPKRV